MNALGPSVLTRVGEARNPDSMPQRTAGAGGTLAMAANLFPVPAEEDGEFLMLLCGPDGGFITIDPGSDDAPSSAGKGAPFRHDLRAAER